MIRRCVDINDISYKNYGGRGISVCERWRNSFPAFLQDMGECPDGYEIDRIDVNANYEPSNCRWATGKQQARNRRNNHNITYKGRTQCLTAWAEELGGSVKTLYNRFHHGWGVEKALTTPFKTVYPEVVE
ncbi:hypothetical protein [Chroococcidiopsis sp. CCMEE 29]|uniref:hypothetical protein n=1 Tax=Chroococcidiopsis sp. CCMEE 29 TaxID=155894 RepID=UPI002021CD90|nr:hypothetical protein [Chroococcidiopsis sp. CCMEE 29]